MPWVFLTRCLNFGLIKLGLCACILVSLISASVWPAGMSVISEVGKPLSTCVKKTFNRRQLSFRKSVARERFLSTVTYSLMSFERSPHYSHSPSFLIFICIPCFACLFDINLLPNLFHSPPVSHVPFYYINLPVSIFSVPLLPFTVHASTLFCSHLLQ